MLMGGGPIGTVNVSACGLGPPLNAAVRVKDATAGHGKSLATVNRYGDPFADALIARFE
jgi:hypothetical protein